MRTSIDQWKVLLLVGAHLLRTTPALAQAADHRPPAAPGVGAPAALAPMGVVHIEAPQAVNLEVSTGEGWERLCVSPCDRAVPTDRTYRITGSSIRDSRGFQLDSVERMTLAVEPTSSGARAGAVVLTVVGVVALLPVAGVTALIVGGEILGAILFCPLAAAFETVKSQQGKEYGDCLGGIATFFAPGYSQPWVWIPGIAGAAMLTGGIVGLASTPRTKVHMSAGGSPELRTAESRPAYGALPMGVLPVVSYPVIAVRF